MTICAKVEVCQDRHRPGQLDHLAPGYAGGEAAMVELLGAIWSSPRVIYNDSMAAR